MTGAIETYFEDGVWKNKVQGSSRAANQHTDKRAAQAVAREMARSRKVEHVVRKKDGTISERNSYGNDPRSIPG
jgi:hypothetical protein